MQLSLNKRIPDTQEERRESRFWQCRRSLRLWPVPEATKEGVREYLTDKLRIDADILDDLGNLTVNKHVGPRSKTKHEVVVVFATKEARDLVKGQAYHLAQYREEAGMKLHLPNYLQKDFKQACLQS